MYIRFIKKVGLLFLLVTTVTFFYMWNYIDRTKKIKIEKNHHILAAGDSHVKCAINDSLTHGIQNISLSSQPYIYTYAVLKRIINNNSHIDTVILGYSFHSTSDVFDDYVDRKFIKKNFCVYVPILDEQTFSYLLKRNPIGLMSLFPNVVNYSFMKGTIGNGSFPFVGKFYRSRKSNLSKSKINGNLNKQYWKGDKMRTKSVMQMEYLRKIVDYCATKKVKLIFINTPIHPSYKKQIPQKFLTGYYDFYNQYSNTVTLVDLHEMKLPDSCYGDGHHVNKYGAELVTKKLDSILHRN